jgi:hypothetical protein
MHEIRILENGNVLISIPIAIQNNSGKRKISSPAPLDGEAQDVFPTDNVLLTTIARAYCWQSMIDSGKFASVRELAKAIGMDESYVSKMMRLNFLSPRIVQVLLNGTAPDTLTLGRFRQAIPELWEEQEKLLP